MFKHKLRQQQKEVIQLKSYTSVSWDFQGHSSVNHIMLPTIYKQHYANN